MPRIAPPVAFFGELEELSTAVVDLPPIAVITSLNSGAQDRILIRQLRVRYPSLPIVGYCRLTALVGQTIIDALRLGMNAVAFQGHDDLAPVMASVIDSARDDVTCTDVTVRNGGLVPSRCRPIFDDCVREARTSLSVAQRASDHAMHRVTLARLLRDAGLCTPQQLVMWGKLFIAASLYSAGADSLEHIARELELGGATALSNAFLARTGRRPSSMPRAQALHFVEESFRQLLTKLGSKKSQSAAG